MQKDLLNQVGPYLAELNGKINTLQFLGKNLNSTQVELIITFSDGDKVIIDQKLIPFNLQMELRTLIDDSIDEYQRIAKHLTEVHNA
jgi:hypothetical protein